MSAETANSTKSAELNFSGLVDPIVLLNCCLNPLEPVDCSVLSTMASSILRRACLLPALARPLTTCGAAFRPLPATLRLKPVAQRPLSQGRRGFASAVAEQPRLRLGSEAPNFRAATTQGEIDFHSWLGGSWAVLFSHPADFTPVCTTELGAFAKMRGEFEARGVKMIGLVSASGGPVVAGGDGSVV